MDYFGKKLQVKGKQLVWENDTPFFYLADTEWYALTNRVDEKTFENILIERKKQGFTAIQIVVGIPPEIDIWDENAKSTNGYFAFNRDFTVNEKYFKDIESKIKLVVKHKLVPILFGSWGHHIDSIGEEGMMNLWSYIVKNFSKYPVIYSLCGEADIFPVKDTIKKSNIKQILYKIPYLRKIIRIILHQIYKQQLKRRIIKWQNVARHLVKINRDKHPVTVHIHSSRVASEVFPDSSWIDIDSFQSGHSISGINLMNDCFKKLKNGNKAFVNLEPLYEGILGQQDIRLQNYAFWKSVFSGAIGHAYGAHGMWQMANNDNFMGHWGKSNWDTALKYNGAVSIGNAKKYVLENMLNWNSLEEKENPVDISYKTNPAIAHLTATRGKKLFIYIPYPDLIEPLELSEFHKAKIIEKLSSHSDLFLEIERV